MMDLAIAIEALVPAAQYGGSTTANDQAAFDALDWIDERPRPTWDQLVAADAAIAARAAVPDNYPALIRRRAAALKARGDQLGALLLLKTIGE
ncbi:MAG: hypothetical protein J0H94_11970 [Rhizobiales bacterium]|nr:hypothetical protein [Hyphomicrobiales bacterium]